MLVRISLIISENKSAVLINKRFPVLYLRDKVSLGYWSKKKNITVELLKLTKSN